MVALKDHTADLWWMQGQDTVGHQLDGLLLQLWRTLSTYLHCFNMPTAALQLPLLFNKVASTYVINQSHGIQGVQLETMQV